MASNSTIELNQLVLLPGQSVLLQNINWSKFEEIISELGEHRASILAYDEGMLEIMVPLPEHEYFKDAIGDLVKDLAFELTIEYECFGSTTWRRQERMGGAEPDNCFYIQNLAAIRGKLDICSMLMSIPGLTPNSRALQPTLGLPFSSTMPR